MAKRGIEVQPYIFFNLGAIWGGQSTPRPGRCTSRKQTRYSLCTGGWVSPRALIERCGSEVSNSCTIRTSSVLLQKVTNSLCLIHTSKNVLDNDFLCFTFKGKWQLIHVKGQKDALRCTGTRRLKQGTYAAAEFLLRSSVKQSVNKFSKFDVLLTVHRSSMWNKKPTRCHLVLYLFLLISCSTCFGPPCAHLQELTSQWYFFTCGVVPWLCRQSDPVGWLCVHCIGKYVATLHSHGTTPHVKKYH